jgi:UDP-N-acetylmuramoyl-tripeptide--D-alanyl-D-alanine ligase
MLTVADVIEALIGVRPEWATQVITEAEIDSRLVIPGSLFVALPDGDRDGHDYVEEAVKRGAMVALVQRDLSERLPVLDLRDIGSASKRVLQPTPPVDPKVAYCLWVENSLLAVQRVAHYWRRKMNVRVVVITGTVGKSTTKEMVADVLNQRYPTLKNPGNLKSEIGLPLTLLSLSEGHQRAVFEMGFYVAGEITFLCDLVLPQVGVVTNVGMVHTESAGPVEILAKGKDELVQALPPSPEGVAILNYDDPLVRDMSRLTRANVFYYGLDPNADLWADNIEGLGLDGIRFQLHYKGEDLFLRVPLIGRHSVHTALRAAAVGLLDGLTWQEIVRGLRSGTTQLRLVAVRTASGALILDDTYSASPQSTLAALNLLDELEGRKVAVLGDMLELGSYEEEGHEIVGLRAAEVVNELVCLGDRARRIASAAQHAGLPSSAVVELDEAQQVIDYLKPRLQAQDVVLVKGSQGLHMDRIVATLEAHE